MARIATIERTTKETAITCTVNLDGTGQVSVDTGIGFFDHMLDALGRHSLIDLDLKCQGDLVVDGHHTVEDCGIVLGQALAQAIGDKRGINRFGSTAVPLDEALVLTSLDFSGRGGLYWQCDVPWQLIGTFDSSLTKEFFGALASNAGITLHLVKMAGENGHHIVEAAFKATARALRQAVTVDPRMAGEMPSTKGML